MPSASSAKLVKQASTEAPDPLRQAIVIIEHKIRNLEKRKGKLEGYRALQAEGKDLQADQLQAVAKYDEVIQTLEFARDLCKQFNGISLDCAKLAKKQARKEALERQAADLARIKEVLLIQNVLNTIGTEAIREDFLTGKNGAIQLSEPDLQLFDTFYETVNPKLFEEGAPAIEEQLSSAAEHFLNTVDGKTKEFGGVTYAVLKERIHNVHTCGYFDSKPVAKTEEEAPAETLEVPEESEVKVETEIVEETEPTPDESIVVINSTFQAPQGAVSPQQMPHVPPHMAGQPVPPTQPPTQPAVEANSFFSNPAPAPGYTDPALPVHPPHPIPAQPNVQVPLRPHDVINSVSSGSFNFLQESELDTPDISGTVPGPHQLTAPIPTQTFTNQSFATSPVNPPPASAVPMYHPPQHQTHIQPLHHVVPPDQFAATPNPPPPIPMPPSHHRAMSPTNPAGAPVVGYPQQMYSPQGDRFDQMPENEEQVPADQSAQVPSQAAASTEWAVDTGDWNAQTNDNDWSSQQHNNQNEWSQAQPTHNDGGYQTQRGSGGSRDRGDRDQKGGRGRGRGQYNGYNNRGRGNRDAYQNDRQGGYGGYRGNGEGSGGNYYQNGYKDGQGGGYRGRGPREGGTDRPRPARGGMDRGGPRGGGRGNPRGRGGYRGGQAGSQGVPAGGPGPKQ